MVLVNEELLEVLRDEDLEEASVREVTEDRQVTVTVTALTKWAGVEGRHRAARFHRVYEHRVHGETKAALTLWLSL